MWDFQWLREFTPLSEELNDSLYYHSQGIISIAVSLYALSQAAAIFQRTERITKEIIEVVAKDDLRLTLNLVKAIRNNNKALIAKYEDVKIDLKELFQDRIVVAEESSRVMELVNEIQKVSKKEIDIKRQVAFELTSMGLFKNLDYKSVETIVENSIKQVGVNVDKIIIKQIAVGLALEEERKIGLEKQTKANINHRKKEYLKDDLRRIYEKANKAKMHVCELMEESGYIVDPINELTL